MEHEPPDIFREPELIADKRNIPLSIIAVLIMLYLLYLISFSAISLITRGVVLWRAGYLPAMAWIMPVLLLLIAYILFRSIVALIRKKEQRAILLAIGGIALFYAIAFGVTLF